MTDIDLRSLKGLVATCVGMGGIDEQYSSAHEEMRFFNVKNGYDNIEYLRFSTVLVEAGRDECAMHGLRNNYDFVLQIDGDAAPFPPDSLVRLLHRAFVEYPDSDAIGAYCQLKSAPYLPTIDTGTGRSHRTFDLRARAVITTEGVERDACPGCTGPAGFGLDLAGELYVASFDGRVHKMVPAE